MEPCYPLQELSQSTKNVLDICKHLRDLGMTPKQFMLEYLTSKNSELATLRRFWATPKGWESTITLVKAIRGKFWATDMGRKKWIDWIQDESSKSVTPAFFTNAARAHRDHVLITHDTPLLYSIIRGMILNGRNDYDSKMDGPEEAVDEIGDDTRKEGELLEGEGISYVKEKDRHKLAIHRAHRVAVTVCSMLSFVRNRRHNSLQLQNAVRFLACGVSERTNEYLHFLGLTSSRQTALDALRALTSAAEERLKTVMALLPLRPAFGPFVCIENLDMQEKVHMSSIGHRSMMFHGTWGYVHMPSQELLDALDGSKLDLTTYQKALNEVKTMDIDPALLMPSSEASEHYHWVMKSQIATAPKKYLRKPLEQEGAIPTGPPVIDQISCKSLEIHMFKLMDESDNSAEGIGQVMEAIQIQSGLTPEEFFSRLQPMDADLGTCQNLKSLWDIRCPSDEPHNSLNNLVMQLGCSHTLWNIAQTIFTKHLGNSSNEDDLGAWRTLSSLGIAPEKVIQKKDFTAMIQHMEKVHESTLVLCLW
ncbi:hypothetical protein PCASD_17509 [Puccinia coronata f. sp. avenae]|uniref:DUF6589 domain-containing protein n=1 Tax=Puccinia coronata f. sp. avenae TaxID=200324 RepID=A0A2N5T3U4_9BASI|nr:hypothetical protein PCASD_26721 [Puccinia coronata f. sp. avenae]PLW20162.1 hypothetical protein PCASD_17509 [Puccinia coronata f. sp. avenae]